MLALAQIEHRTVYITSPLSFEITWKREASNGTMNTNFAGYRVPTVNPDLLRSELCDEQLSQPQINVLSNKARKAGFEQAWNDAVYATPQSHKTFSLPCCVHSGRTTGGALAWAPCGVVGGWELD